MILIDNTVLSNFAQVGLLSLLEKYCQNKGCTTSEVLLEFEAGLQKQLFSQSHSLGWLTPIQQRTPKEEMLYHSFCKQLDQGEASCLAIAISKDYNFLSDDLAARKVALQAGIPLSGTLGVLVRLIQMNQLTLEKGNQILSLLIKKGYFSPVDQLDNLF